MAFVLTPVPPVADWLSDFDAFAKRSPGFFAGRPVVVDISQMPPTRPDLVHLITELKRRHIIILALDGRAPGELGADARGLPPILSGSKDIKGLAEDIAAAGGAAVAAATGDDDKADIDIDSTALAAVEAALDEPVATGAPAEIAETPVMGGNLIVTEPVRSGQSIVHLDGDVTVIGTIASGSEVVAGGSIHVYGTLKGRAIAGSNGAADARIFCQALNAELIAINGLYKTADDIDRATVGRAVQVWLDGDTLNTKLIQKGRH